MSKVKKFIIKTQILPEYLTTREQFIKAVKRELEWILIDSLEWWDKNYKKK